MIYPITPIPKPRQTRRDAWKKRPCVVRYRAFADECRVLKVIVKKKGSHVIFHMPMPECWSLAKKNKLAGKPHEQKPDIDNLGKALLDAVLKEDCVVSDIRLSKRWAKYGAIEIINNE